MSSMGHLAKMGLSKKFLKPKAWPTLGRGPRAVLWPLIKRAAKPPSSRVTCPTAYQVLTLAGATARQVTIPLPLVMKPLCEGSSMGVHIIKDESGIAPAIADLAKFGETALVEPFVSGKELTVGILGDQVLPIVHIQPRSGFYDIANKYPWMGGSGGSDYFCPADLCPETTAAVQDAALAAHRSLGVEVYSRVDVLLDDDEVPFVLEVNTIPGMTSTSLLPKAAAAVGIDYPTLCARILELSLAVNR